MKAQPISTCPRGEVVFFGWLNELPADVSKMTRPAKLRCWAPGYINKTDGKFVYSQMSMDDEGTRLNQSQACISLPTHWSPVPWELAVEGGPVNEEVAEVPPAPPVPTPPAPASEPPAKLSKEDQELLSRFPHGAPPHLKERWMAAARIAGLLSKDAVLKEDADLLERFPNGAPLHLKERWDAAAKAAGWINGKPPAGKKVVPNVPLVPATTTIGKPVPAGSGFTEMEEEEEQPWGKVAGSEKPLETEHPDFEWH